MDKTLRTVLESISTQLIDIAEECTQCPTEVWAARLELIRGVHEGVLDTIVRSMAELSATTHDWKAPTPKPRKVERLDVARVNAGD